MADSPTISSSGSADVSGISHRADLDAECGADVSSQTGPLDNKTVRDAARFDFDREDAVGGKNDQNLCLLAQVDVDIGEAVKKLSNRNIMLVAKALYDESPLSSNELQKRTGLKGRMCTYAIQEMKTSGLILSEDRKYYLTNYALAVIVGLFDLKRDLERYSGEMGSALFAPINRGNKKGNKNDDGAKPIISKSCW
jgi:hypothetical protein